VKTYVIEVRGTLKRRFKCQANDLEGALAAAAKWANNHLRDDGFLINVTTALTARNVMVTPEELARGIGELDPRYRALKEVD